MAEPPLGYHKKRTELLNTYLLLPELDEEVKDKYPYKDVIRPEDFAEFLRLSGNAVLNASCMGGMQSLAEVFLEMGANYYIGPIDYPDSSASLMYVLDFLYNYIQNGQNVEEAHQVASRYPDDRRLFRLYGLLS